MERGALIADRYELTRLLGRGGMGEVWAARDRRLHRGVAVKLLRHDDLASRELVRRFAREAVAAAQINHPNVVALHDSGVHEDVHFLVMEHIEGTSLAEHLHRQGPLPLARALAIAEEICAALVAAHAVNVVHYDIKPSNVMLTAGGSIKVVDFGIAGFTHAHTFTVAPTSVLSPVGTAQYGAPEQFLDQRGDERSDLYALGSVLFALLTGEPPFGDGTPLAVVRRKLDEEPRPVTALRADVPASLARLLTDLLQRDPDDRPRTAATVGERLARLRADTDQTAPLPQATPTRALSSGGDDKEDAEPLKAAMPDRPWRDRRGVASLTALSAVLLVAAAVTYYVTAAHRDDRADGTDGAGSAMSPSPTATAQFRRMPDVCGYLDRNELRGFSQLAGWELPQTDNDSKNANCGWKANGNFPFKLTIEARLLDSEADAHKEIASFTPGPNPFDRTINTSKVPESDLPAEEALQSVQDESSDKSGKKDGTSVHFRQDNLFITVSYRESEIPADETGRQEFCTSRAVQIARILDGFLTDEPENREKPVWN
ncbi:serine/threonine-protein kinase [Streptomyces sp. NRRL F-4707]|uniref:serine/threonine-protein kinase n=1 Tax=Streptomyces sp. NRRL F-4707 TaxID=1519496 RepID=UPI0006B0360F|nr:serine/threonine-protein kinase [Streptomyces sp. NRRL F-4707]